MTIMKNNKEVGFIKKALLPEEYQRVEYIQSTGTQYIDTGVRLSNTTGVEITAEIKSSADKMIFAHMGYLRVGSNNYGLYYAWSGTSFTPTTYRPQIQNIKFNTQVNYYNSRKILYNGVYNANYGTISTVTGQSTSTATIFGRKTTSGTVDYLINAKLYSLKITDENSLVREFIPCYRKSDEEIGVYDIVNGVFYTNQGTGTFGKGNDIVDGNIDKIYYGEDLVFEQGFTRTQSGTPPLYTSYQPLGKNLKNYKIYGNSIQNAIPTSTTPIEIQSVGDSPNLVTFENNSSSSSSVALRSQNDNFTIKGNASGTTLIPFYANNGIKPDFTLPAGTYTISVQGTGTITSNTAFLQIYRVVSGELVWINVCSLNESKTFTLANTSTIRLRVIVTNGISYDAAFNIQLEKGSQKTTYVPYGKYAIPIIVSGKNLIDYSKFGYAQQTTQSTPNINNGEKVVYDNKNCLQAKRAFYSNSCFWSGWSFPLRTGDVVSLSMNCQLVQTTSLTSKNIRIGLIKQSNGLELYQSKTLTSFGVWEEISTTKTITEDGVYFLVAQPIGNSGASTNLQCYFYNIQLEFSNNATTYSDYKEINTTLYLDSPLRKAGDYADYIDFKTQKFYQEIGEYTFTGNETWSSGSITGGFYWTAPREDLMYLASDDTTMLCTNYVFGGTKTESPYYGNDGEFTCWVGSIWTKEIYVVDTNNSTTSEMATSIAGAKLIFPLATPSETSVTLPTLPSYNETTIYSIGSKINPSSIYIQYRSK